MPKIRHEMQYEPLSEKDVFEIHKTVMRVLEEVGVEVNNKKAVELFHGAGAEVDEDRKTVRFNSRMVTALIEKAPSTVRLCGREPEYDVVLQPNSVFFGTGGTALYVLDPGATKRRKATLRDVHAMARLCHELENVHIFMLPLYPSDISEEDVDVNRFFAGFLNTAKHVMGGVYSPRGVKQVIKVAEEIAGSPEKLLDRPFLSMITCVISPLKLDQHYTALLKQVARAGIPVVCPSEPLCGLTSPVTLAGNTVIQTADSLAAVMLTQLVNPGAPVIFGTVASSANFRDMRYLAGPVEVGILSAAQAQMARFYNLPFYAVGGMSDSKIPDAQAGYESAMTILLNALGGANFVHDAIGLCDFALTMSYEKAVIDNEIVGMALRAVRGIEVNEETLAFEAIRKAGPGGNFMTDPGTVKHMRLEHYIPKLANRDEQDKWLKSGAPNLRRKSSDFIREILSQTSEHRLDSTLVDKLIADYPVLTVPGKSTEVANR